MPPKVSVVIPSFNRWPLVAETVENMLGQSLAPHEVIVVDDGSSDGSAGLLRERFGGRIRVIEQANQGPGAARNAGLKVATGEFIHLMDSDDLVSRNKLETQTDALIRSGGDIVYGPWAPVYFKGRNVSLKDHVLQQRPLPDDRDGITWYMTDWAIVFQTMLVRRSLIERAGFYRTDMWSSDDTEYFMRLLTASPKLAFDERALTLYRLDDHGKVTGSGRPSTRKMVDWAKTVLANVEHAKRIGHPAWRHPQSRLRVQNALEDLLGNCPDERELVEQLTAIRDAIPASAGFPMKRRLGQLRAGLRRRLYGSRWSRPYQAGPFQAFQKQLVEELGFVVA